MCSQTLQAELFCISGPSPVGAPQDLSSAITPFSPDSLSASRESQRAKRSAVRLMIRSTAQQRHCCCLRKQVPQQSGQHADLVNCAQRSWKNTRFCDVFAKCDNISAQGLKEGHWEGTLKNISWIISVISMLNKIGNQTAWRRDWQCGLLTRFRVSNYVIKPLNSSNAQQVPLQSPNYQRSAFNLDFTV